MDEKRKEVLRSIHKIIRRNGFDLRYRLEFPIYKILPEEVGLALKILEKHGMNIVIDLKEKPKK